MSKVSDLFTKLMAKYDDFQIEQIGKCWFLASKKDRKHRLKSVMLLSVELEAIKKISTFSTAFGEQLIEAIIQGDWKEAEQVLAFLSFKEDGPEIEKKYVPLWEGFKAVALFAIEENKRLENSTGENTY